jgi:hypothetical protein
MTKGTQKVSPEAAKEAQIDALCLPFTRPAGARRPSAAEIKKREAYEAQQRERAGKLIDDNAALQQEVADLKRQLAAAQDELAAANERNMAAAKRADQITTDLRNQKTAVLKARAAAEIQADLSCMMPGELRPTLKWEPSPSGGIYSYQFDNEHGTFRLKFTVGVTKLEVTPSDMSRRPREVDVSYEGIPDESVERLIGILGLPADTSLPSRARRNLRKEGRDAQMPRLGLTPPLMWSPPEGEGDLVVLLVDSTFYEQHSSTENPAR